MESRLEDVDGENDFRLIASLGSGQARMKKNIGKEFGVDSQFENAVSDDKTVLCHWETRDVGSWHLTKVEGPKVEPTILMVEIWHIEFVR